MIAEYLEQLSQECVRDNRSNATDMIAESVTNYIVPSLIRALSGDDNLLTLGGVLAEMVTNNIASSEGYREFMEEYEQRAESANNLCATDD